MYVISELDMRLKCHQNTLTLGTAISLVHKLEGLQNVIVDLLICLLASGQR